MERPAISALGIWCWTLLKVLAAGRKKRYDGVREHKSWKFLNFKDGARTTSSMSRTINDVLVRVSISEFWCITWSSGSYLNFECDFECESNFEWN